MKHIILRPRAVLSLIVPVCLLSLSAPVSAAGNYPEWHTGKPVIKQTEGQFIRDDAEAAGKGCTVRTVMVRDYAPGPACVTEMDGWSYALFTRFYSEYGMTQSDHFFVVGLGADTKMYVVDGLPGSVAPVAAPGADDLVDPAGAMHFAAYRNFPKFLVRNATGYELSKKAPDILRGVDGEPIDARTVAISRGGGWLALETARGIVRISLTTLAARIVSPITTRYDAGYGPRMELAISDDGQTIFVGGRLYAGRQFAVITVTDGCGVGLPRSCPSRDLTTFFTDSSLPDGWPVGLVAGIHGNRLDFFVDGFDGRYARFSLYPDGSIPTSVRYLALGDSFSSGEGDPGADKSTGVPYYLPHTDDVVNGETCHLSRRSYPFVLASLAGLDAFASPAVRPVRSVACSGAQITDINGFDYEGQAARLKSRSTAERERLRAEALTTFIPGRLRQLDFVEEYQPRALSLSIGGNDIQFSRVIAACAHSVVTCEYAADPTDRRNLGESIGLLYPKLGALYAELARSDDGARLVAVGYPRFINSVNVLCPLTTNLDLNERIMIDEGVRYINDVIKAAAESAGVGYADVEDALASHRACDSPGGYVNEIDLWNTKRFETFHPNNLGHGVMANAISRRMDPDLTLATYCRDGRYPCPEAASVPSLPSFFGDKTVRAPLIAVPSGLLGLVEPIVVKGTTIIVRTAMLAAGSRAEATLHSDAVYLGNGTVATDGALEMPIVLPPSVEPGYHTLHLYATSPSGEALDMYEILYVEAAANEAPPTGQGDTAAAPVTPVSSQAAPDAPTPRGAQKSFPLIDLLPATVGRFGILWLVPVLAAAAAGLVYATRAVWRRRGR